MRCLLTISLVLALILAPIRAEADSSVSTSSAARVALTPVRLNVNSKSGVWLPSDQMARVVLRLETADKLEGVVSAQETLIGAQKRSIETSSVTISTLHQLSHEQKLRGDDFKTLAEKQSAKLEELDSWYRSPLFWTGVGAAGAIILSLLVAGHGNSPTVNVQR